MARRQVLIAPRKLVVTAVTVVLLPKSTAGTTGTTRFWEEGYSNYCF
jgi:hypothetical protein